MKLRLLVKPTPEAPYFYEPKGSLCHIGRNPGSDVALAGPGIEGVSWEHARIELTPRGALLTDLGSTNGTFVNGSRVQEPVALRLGDCIRLGQKGPTLEVVGLNGAVAPAVKAPATPARSPRPAPVAGGTADARNLSPTRFLLIKMQDHLGTMQSRYRRVLAAAAVAGALVVVAVGILAWLHKLEVARVRRENEEAAAANQARIDEANAREQNLARLLAQLKSDMDLNTEDIRRQFKGLAEQKARDAEGYAVTIKRRYMDSVYLVALFDPGDRLIGHGTAFAVDPSGKFATNAHVADPVAKLLTNGGKALLIAQGAVRRYSVREAATHPGYAGAALGRVTPDVGLLTVDLPPGEPPLKTVELASDADLRQLEDGAPLCYIGYPGFEGDRFFESPGAMDARIYTGHLVRHQPLDDSEARDFAHARHLEHDMFSWGGASGSPIFNQAGKVVAIHYRGDFIEGHKQAASPKWAMRIDLLQPLLHGAR
jgi:hypothetical protein